MKKWFVLLRVDAKWMNFWVKPNSWYFWLSCLWHRELPYSLSCARIVVVWASAPERTWEWEQAEQVQTIGHGLLLSRCPGMSRDFLIPANALHWSMRLEVLDTHLLGTSWHLHVVCTTEKHACSPWVAAKSQSVVAEASNPRSSLYGSNSSACQVHQSSSL